jgi:hypothetical protein
MKRESFAQSERQAARRKDGHYAAMNECEVCGKPLGSRYFSAVNSNETGRGVCLCKKCCKAWDATADLITKARA